MLANLGKDVAEILGYSGTAKAIRTHVDGEDKETPQFRAPLAELKK